MKRYKYRGIPSAVNCTDGNSSQTKIDVVEKVGMSQGDNMMNISKLHDYQKEFKHLMKECERRGGKRGARRKAHQKLEIMYRNKPALHCFEILDALELVR